MRKMKYVGDAWTAIVLFILSTSAKRLLIVTIVLLQPPPCIPTAFFGSE